MPESADAAAGGYKYCDLVMKGGITSGVIYPAAACRLAEEYRFKNIGGTSAGAIAAAVTAAAEYGRRSGNCDAFETLAALPGELGKDNLLLKLFAPDAATERVFRVLTGMLAGRNVAEKILGVYDGLLECFGQWFALGFLLAGPVLLVGYEVLSRMTFDPGTIFRHLREHFVLCLAQLMAAVVAGLALSLAMALREGIRAIPANGFGLCSGLARAPGCESLTGWLHRQIQLAAGRPENRPLTFRDLWNAPQYPGETLKTERTINLEMVTTSLSEGRPYSIPLISGALYFDPRQWEKLFPEPVMAQLCGKWWTKSEPQVTPGKAQAKPQSGRKSAPKERPVVSPVDENVQLCLLPPRDNLPIVVATRMSLSFPLLLSAVPLYNVDYEIRRNKDKKCPTRVGSKVWFSDGGICSNFPLSFFDSPLPRWPSFGLNLRQAAMASCNVAAGKRNAAAFVDLPKAVGNPPVIWNSLGDAQWTPSGVVEGDDPVRCLVKFGGSITNTMQNWRDSLQAGAAGYRDRIVSVSLCADEGGLNLNMPPELIDALSARGKEAAERLITKFDFSQHAFTRFRITLGALEDYLERFRQSYANPVPQDTTGWNYVNGKAIPPYYDWRHDSTRKCAHDAALDLLQLIDGWNQSMKDDQRFKNDAPRPKALLQARPDF